MHARDFLPPRRAVIVWTALARIAALPLGLLPGPLVTTETPFAAQTILWGCTSVLIAYVMALITWQGAKRLRT